MKQGVVPTAAFAAGYLVTWLAFSVAATLLMWALEGVGWCRSAWAHRHLAIGVGSDRRGALPALPLEALSARLSRAAEFLTRHWRPGSFGALRMGLEHGAFCVGCCWVLMALLFVGGIMNVLWIAALAILVLFGEGRARRDLGLSNFGAVLIAWGVATFAV